MFKTAIPFFIRAITPVHAGSGNDLGIVDLPIQREAHTGFPKIEASTLKGCIRNAFEIKANGNEKEEIKIQLIFGLDGTNASSKVKDFFEKTLDFTQFASAITFTDARILLFPVKSLKGVFAYVTCPTVLKRLEEDLKMAFLKDEIKIIINQQESEEIEFKADNYKVEKKANVNKESKLIVQGNQVVLEEYLFEVEEKDDVSNLSKILSKLIGIEENLLKVRLIILDDDDFTDFVKLSTEVITRIKINNETGIVDKGALFTEEYLPAETVMYSIAFFSPLFIDKDKNIKLEINEKIVENFKNYENLKKIEKDGKQFIEGTFENFLKNKTDLKNFDENEVKSYFENTLREIKTLQIGGNETIGKGFIEVNLFNSN